jgi:hypothetical protein
MQPLHRRHEAVLHTVKWTVLIGVRAPDAQLAASSD